MDVDDVNREGEEVRRWDDSWRRRWRARSFLRWCISREGVDVDVEVGSVGLVVVVFLVVVDEGGFVV